jgi:hypothetical protein
MEVHVVVGESFEGNKPERNFSHQTLHEEQQPLFGRCQGGGVEECQFSKIHLPIDLKGIYTLIQP